MSVAQTLVIAWGSFVAAMVPSSAILIFDKGTLPKVF